MILGEIAALLHHVAGSIVNDNLFCSLLDNIARQNLPFSFDLHKVRPWDVLEENNLKGKK